MPEKDFKKRKMSAKGKKKRKSATTYNKQATKGTQNIRQ